MENQDRELLELAAKAAGLSITGWNKRNSQHVAVLSDGSYWQPLLENSITDTDGDALRLAACLEIVVDTYNHRAALSSSFMDGQGDWVDGDDYKHAIVLLAADIGRNM